MEISKIKSKMSVEKPYNLEPHVEAALSYIPLIAVAVLIVEKENKFVRFHAYQSVFFWAVSFAIFSMTSVLKVILIGFLLEPLVEAGIVITWFYLGWKAYNKIEIELPIIGKLAKEQVED
jgi:uncharacterized membrane protein